MSNDKMIWVIAPPLMITLLLFSQPRAAGPLENEGGSSSPRLRNLYGAGRQPYLIYLSLGQLKTISDKENYTSEQKLHPGKGPGVGVHGGTAPGLMDCQ